MIGKKLGGRYEIISSIGEGGMSVVYKAKDLLLNRIVAVKILKEQFIKDEEFVRRFRREAQASASLSHINIVSTFDVGQDKSLYYLVMEYVQGNTLKKIIREQGPLELFKIINIAKQICDALEHAHNNNLIHRDIKPHNILINEEGIVKVTDFGIARAVSTDTITHTKDILGSVHYLSPEQAKGELAGVRSDLYSLGIILYEMATKKLPFSGETPVSIALQHIHNNPPNPSFFNEQINDNLEKIILKCLEKKVENRYEDAGELKKDLFLLLEGKNIDYEINDLDNTLIFSNQLINKEQTKKLKLKPLGFILLGVFVLSLLAGLYWSMGKLFVKEEVIVPDVVNLPVLKGKRMLADRNLKLQVDKEIHNNEIPKDNIINQDPLPDSVIKAGRNVKVTISKGPYLVKVPDVLGKNEVIADVRITNANLSIGEIDRVFSLEYPEGEIISQDPLPDKEVTEKTKVDLVISKGPEPSYVALPPFIGLELNEAQEKISTLGFSLGEIKEEKSELYPLNFVINQEPSSGQEILQGSKINLVISQGPGPTSQVAAVRLRLTQSGILKISVSDILGIRDEYEKYHNKGDSIAIPVNYYGQAVITVFLDDNKIWEQNEPRD